jgi:hypothetical protein
VTSLSPSQDHHDVIDLTLSATHRELRADAYSKLAVQVRPECPRVPAAQYQVVEQGAQQLAQQLDGEDQLEHEDGPGDDSEVESKSLTDSE